MTLTWYVDVDWNNDETYEGEEGTGLSPHLLYDVDITRGRKIVTRFTDREASGVAYVDVGKATLSFHNTDGRYDPYNASSPLHDNLLPGRMARVRVNDGATTEDVITGRIQNITPLTESNGHEKAIIEIVDGLQLLTLDKAALVAITTSTLIRNIIAGLIYPWGYGIGPISSPGIDAAEVSTATLDVWFSGDTPLDAIRKLSEAEKGVFFVDRHGVQTFYSINLVQSSAATWTDTQIARNGIALPNPWDNYRDKITVKSYNYEVAGLPRTDLWTYGEELFVPATTSVVIRAEYAGAADILDPVETTDYRMFSETGGGGTERTTTFTVTADKYSNYSDITVTAGIHDGYIYLLKIRGKAISSAVATYISAPDTNLVNLSVDNPWIKDRASALAMQSYYKDFFSGGDGFPSVRMRNKPTVQFARDLFDVVHLESTEKSLDQDYRIGWVHHKWVEPGGQIVDSTFGLEPAGTWIHPDLTFDAASGATPADAATSITFSHTIGAGQCRRLDVALETRSASAITGVTATYNGVAMTAHDSNTYLSTTYHAVYSFVMFEADMPAAGAHDVVISWTNAANAMAGGISHSNANQSVAGTSVKATASSTTPSVDVPSAVGDIVIDACCMRYSAGDTLTVGAGQTQRYNAYAANAFGAGSTEPGAATVTMSWTGSAARVWIMMGWNIKAV